MTDDQKLWYKDAIIYELHIKAFRDGDGDGIGDFKGLMEKLDYLQDLGITAIWLLPFYPSPQKDDGYDIADYYNINPAYGNISQFQDFLKEAHRRKLKVITELVINHTSNEHPWFERARRAPAGSEERNFYVWSDDPNKYKDVRIIFQDFESSNWTFDPVAQQYYWHRFFQHQPDLNFDSPLVQQEIFKIVDFWCGLGVDGFRLDAVPYLFEREGTNGENLPETHQFLKKVRRHVDDHFPGTLLLAEANMWPEDSASYFGNGDECQMNYHFPVMPRLFMALQMENRYPITDIFDQTPAIPDNCQWAIFLRNHDELTLEMVTDEERDYMYKTYVKDPKARINLGIRHRLAPLLGNNRKKIELMNCLLLSLPGTPVLYYGDEIGMGDNFYLGDRNGVRTPMQWSADRNAGFSEANPQQLYLPIILDPQYHYEAVNVDLQQENISSLLWHTKRLLALRKRYKVFGRGSMRFVPCANTKILAFVRVWNDQSLLVIVNLSRYTQPVDLDLNEFDGFRPVEVSSHNKFPNITSDHYFMTLSEYGCEWFLLEKTKDLLHEKKGLARLVWNDAEALTHRENLQQIAADILPDYLCSVRWFGGKGKTTEHIRVIADGSVVLDESKAHYLLLEVAYQDGIVDNYQLAVMWLSSEKVKPLREKFPGCVLAEVELAGKDGVLIDAFYDASFQKQLFMDIVNASGRETQNGKLIFESTELLKPYAVTESKILSADQSNTCILYGDKYFLKMFRKVDASENPDVEITRFLTEKKFDRIPSFLGSVKFRRGGSVITLGMLQEQVVHQSDGWVYFTDQLSLFFDRIPELSKSISPPPLAGTFTNPAGYDGIPSPMRELISAPIAEQIRILGMRTGEMHLALSTGTKPEFKPEGYSLHYQRSLFAGLQTLVRTAFQSLAGSLDQLEPNVRDRAMKLLQRKESVLTELRKIYSKPISTTKIRVHGDYHLGQVLFTGKDFVITDFEGEPSRSFSERKLRRSPLRDVAGMIRSFHYAAHSARKAKEKHSTEHKDVLAAYAYQWYHYASTIFLKSYLASVAGSSFIPSDKDDFAILLRTFLLEKAIYELDYEINNRPEWITVPMAGLEVILNENAEGVKKEPITH